MIFKYILTFLLSLVFLVTNASGQISELEKIMSVGAYNSLVLQIPNTERKLVEGLWKKHLKQFGGKTKRNKRAKEYFTENGNVTGLGVVDIFSNIAKNGSDIELTVWVDMGGDYLSSYSHPEKYIEAEKVLMRFALEVTREKIRLELKAEEKNLKKMEKNLKKLVKANHSYHREIKEAEERIQKAEANIAQNEIEQTETKSSMEQQQAIVEEVRKRLSDL